AERSHSGLVHRSRKPEWVYAHRGFESHPLRQKNCGLRIAEFKRNNKSAIRNSQSEILPGGDQNEIQSRTNNHSFDLRIVTVRVRARLQDAGQEEPWQAIE